MAAKVLGQAAPGAASDTTLYTVPSDKTAVSSTLVVCNRDTTITGNYHVAVRPAGAALTNQHYIVSAMSLPASSTDAWTIGLTLAATDVVTVRASTASFSFTLFGDET